MPSVGHGEDMVSFVITTGLGGVMVLGISKSRASRCCPASSQVAKVYLWRVAW